MDQTLTTSKRGHENPAASATWDPRQTLVQGDINSPENQQKIADWQNGPHNGNPKQDQLTINETLPAGSAGTGRVVVDQNGTHQVVDGNGVRAVLKYNKDLNPPFYVYTAFPTRNSS